MQHWVLDALRGSTVHHEEIYPFRRQGSKGNLWIVVRLPHPLSITTEKDVEFQIGFWNPTGRSYSLKVDWDLHRLSGQSTCPVKPAASIRGTVCDRILARVTAPLGVLVQGKATVSESTQSIDCMTECSH